MLCPKCNDTLSLVTREHGNQYCSSCGSKIVCRECHGCGEKYMAYEETTFGTWRYYHNHVCDPKRVAAKDGASNREDYSREPSESQRLREGFQMLSDDYGE